MRSNRLDQQHEACTGLLFVGGMFSWTDHDFLLWIIVSKADGGVVNYEYFRLTMLKVKRELLFLCLSFCECFYSYLLTAGIFLRWILRNTTVSQLRTKDLKMLIKNYSKEY